MAKHIRYVHIKQRWSRLLSSKMSSWRYSSQSESRAWSQLTRHRWTQDPGKQQCQSLSLSTSPNMFTKSREPSLTIGAFRAVARAEAALEAAEPDEVMLDLSKSRTVDYLITCRLFGFFLLPWHYADSTRQSLKSTSPVTSHVFSLGARESRSGPINRRGMLLY